MNYREKITQSLIISTVVVCVFIPVITIAAEVDIALKTWLKVTFLHHWIGKGVLATLVFFVSSFMLYPIPYKASLKSIEKMIFLISLVAAISVLVIFGFFTFNFLAHQTS